MENTVNILLEDLEVYNKTCVIPVSLTTKTHSDFDYSLYFSWLVNWRSKRINHQLHAKQYLVTISIEYENDWIIGNLQAIGKYL